MRILFVTNIPSPYQIDFFTALAKQPELEFEVLFCAAKEHDRQFNVPTTFEFPATILPSFRLPKTPKDWHWVRRMDLELEKRMPFDVAILSGSYFMPAIRAARRFVQQQAVPWYYWGENPCKKFSDGWKDRMKVMYLKRFLGGAAGIFGVGQRACKSYRELAHPGQVIENLPYSPNLQPLLSPEPATLALANEYRNYWSTQNPFVIHFSGSLTYRKAPDVLVDAFIGLSEELPDLCLQLAGDGPMRSELETRLLAAGLDDRVRFFGFLDQRELWASYLSADVFVLPTRTHEGWGVVIQEALAAGLPIIATDKVGAVDDFKRYCNVLKVIEVDSSKSMSNAIQTFFNDGKSPHSTEVTCRSLYIFDSARASERFTSLISRIKSM